MSTRQQHARPASPRRAAAERGALVSVLLLGFTGGYYGIAALSVEPGAGHWLRTPLDGRIPFAPASVAIYASVYVTLFLPAFVVRSPALFRRVAAAYGAVLAVAFACFAALPVSADGLRPPPDALPEGFVGWGLRVLYALDPPTNLFPSLHLAIASLAALAAREARPALGPPALALAAAIAVSVLTTRQHYVADAVAGAALGVAAHVAIVHSRDAAADGERAYSWRGPAAFLACLALYYLALYAAYRAGLTPPG